MKLLPELTLYTCFLSFTEEKRTYTRCIFNNEVDVVGVLEVVEELDDVLMVQAVHNLDLSLDLIDHTSLFYVRLLHLLECVGNP